MNASVQQLSLCEMCSILNEKDFAHLHKELGCLDLRRISFGSSVCEKQLLFLQDKELNFLHGLAADMGAHLTLTIPCPRESLIDLVRQKVEHILTALPTCDEIVVNDWAMVDWFRHRMPQRTIVAGRLLCAYEHDPRMDNSDERCHEVVRILKTHALRGMGIAEVDSLEPQQIGISVPDIEVRYHWPAIMLSSTKYCQYSTEGLGATEFLHQYKHCKQQCQQVYSHYSGHITKFGRAIYAIVGPEVSPAVQDHIIYWPINEYRELFV